MHCGVASVSVLLSIRLFDHVIRGAYYFIHISCLTGSEVSLVAFLAYNFRPNTVD